MAEKLLPFVTEQVKKVLLMMEQKGHPMKITSTYRSFDEQNKLYAQGRTKPGNIVTNARGGESWHNYRVAADLCFTTGEPFGESQPWDVYGKVSKDHGFEWGGDWKQKDRPHIQMRFGQDEFKLKAMGEIEAINLLTRLAPKLPSSAPAIAPWAEDAAEKAKKKGVIINWSTPQGWVDDETYQYIFHKLGVLEKVDKDKPITRERMAVILDRLHLLD